MRMLSVTEICRLFEMTADRTYDGEDVTLFQHGLQTAWLAERAQATSALVAACLLHDIGHLLDDQSSSASRRDIDDQHEHHGADALASLFGPEVTEPIRLHVAAKRHLCHTRPDYLDALSADSRRSLDLQGGAFSAEESAAFLFRPHATDAVNLRLWDDQAKLASVSTPSLAHFAATLRICALPKG
jgi:phosphonate degradation associated HDIG domain protein